LQAAFGRLFFLPRFSDYRESPAPTAAAFLILAAVPEILGLVSLRLCAQVRSKDKVVTTPNWTREPMKRIGLVALIAISQVGFAASAEEHGRIKKKPPTPLEAERIASDMAMNDGTLQKGDIVATDRGFFLFRGLGADGISNDFVPVPNPLPAKGK
jgi:hypothetical protein